VEEVTVDEDAEVNLPFNFVNCLYFLKFNSIFLIQVTCCIFHFGTN